MKLTHKSLVACAVAGLFYAMPASAGGFLADTFIRPFSPQMADQADGLNHRLGHPVENAVSRAADSYIPGSGAALQAGWEFQRRLQDADSAARGSGRGQGQPSPGRTMPQTPEYQQQGGRMAGRGYQPTTYQNNGGSFAVASVCRAGMYYAMNRGAGPVGAPCGLIADPMGGVWPGFYSPN